ncbi:MAG: hypothetical protein WA667_23095 [Candidatus Nitrosopolaris sp.]
MVLDGERYANEKYDRLAKKYRMKDLVTQIFEDLVTDEVSEEEDWKSFWPGLKQKYKQK